MPRCKRRSEGDIDATLLLRSPPTPTDASSEHRCCPCRNAAEEARVDVRGVGGQLGGSGGDESGSGGDGRQRRQ